MKVKIPAALREQVWLAFCGDRLFKHKCLVTWCENVMTPFNFEVGHNVPESKGGATDMSNLRPICGKCNRSMGDEYTIDEFSKLSRPNPHLWECFRFADKTKPDISYNADVDGHRPFARRGENLGKYPH
jgi:5-methylcytosine-specific restriction endonuclease McrA